MDIEYFALREHIDSVEWIYNLPKGLIHEIVDLRNNTLSITARENGYQIYVGSKDSDTGGDGILVTLDKAFQLIGYVIERIEPLPHSA